MTVLYGVILIFDGMQYIRQGWTIVYWSFIIDNWHMNYTKTDKSKTTNDQHFNATPPFSRQYPQFIHNRNFILKAKTFGIETNRHSFQSFLPWPTFQRSADRFPAKFSYPSDLRHVSTTRTSSFQTRVVGFDVGEFVVRVMTSHLAYRYIGLSPLMIICDRGCLMRNLVRFVIRDNGRDTMKALCRVLDMIILNSEKFRGFVIRVQTLILENIKIFIYN